MFMNEKKICFIIWYNNDIFLSECIAYINTLHVPDGFCTDICSVADAPSMAAGYQYAMTHSDAKYKVYLHQDVFIIYQDFLINMLDVFQKDSSIGMLGLVGTVQMPESDVMWENACRCGCCRNNIIIQEDISYFPHAISDDYIEVVAIDGLLMATCQDIPWREDLFTGWDFYDISQSEEFRRAGYKVVVPRQDTAWVIHDDDLLNLSDYNYWKDIYLKEYRRNAD